jgi:alpha/beta superfamily hydrolase
VEPVRFSTEDGLSLQGELRRPDAEPRGSTVLCHPHPRLGGSKDHPLLWAIRNELAARGFAVLSFNFRGVGGSDGTYGGGRAERRDVDAALTRVREEAEGPTLLCGWSFGGMVALGAAPGDPRVAGLALVGLPVSDPDIDVPDPPTDAELRAFRRPVLLLSGQGDRFSTRPDLESLARRLPRAEVEIVPGTDHFFWRREKEAADRVADFAERLLGL